MKGVDLYCAPTCVLEFDSLWDFRLEFGIKWFVHKSTEKEAYANKDGRCRAAGGRT